MTGYYKKGAPLVDVLLLCANTHRKCIEARFPGSRLQRCCSVLNQFHSEQKPKLVTDTESSCSLSPVPLWPLWSSTWTRTAGCTCFPLSVSGPGPSPLLEKEHPPTLRRRRRVSAGWDRVQKPGTNKRNRLRNRKHRTIKTVRGTVCYLQHLVDLDAGLGGVLHSDLHHGGALSCSNKVTFSVQWNPLPLFLTDNKPRSQQLVSLA